MARPKKNKSNAKSRTKRAAETAPSSSGLSQGKEAPSKTKEPDPARPEQAAAGKTRRNKARSGSQAPGWWRYFPLLIVLAGLFAYQSSFDAVFVFDDESFTRNSQVVDPVSFAHIIAETQRPLVNLTLAFNHARGGLDPSGYHLFNLVIHLIAGLALFGLLRRVLAENPNETLANAADGFAGTVALLFVVHPLQTQAVTYVIQRAESMMGMFYLLMLYCIIRSARSTTASSRWAIAAVASCAGGMWCKPVMLTAPLVALVFDWVFIAKTPQEIFRKRWPLHAGLFSTWSILISLGALQYFDPHRVGTVGLAVKTVTPLEYLLSQGGVILHYLRLSVWPHRLCLDYQWDVARGFAATIPQSLTLAVLFLLTCRAVMRKRWIGFVGAWFFLVLAPTSSFMPVQDLAVEHRMYLPIIAPLLLMVFGAHVLLQRALKAQPLRSFQRVWGPTLAVGLVTLVLMATTSARNRDYHSRISIWTDVIEQRPNSWRAHGEYGRALAEVLGQHQEAVVEYEKSIEIKSNWAVSHFNLANSLRALGRHEESAAANRLAISFKENYAEATINLGRSLMDLNRHDEAEVALRSALTMELSTVDRSKAHNNLGLTLMKLKRYEEAVKDYQEAIRLDPSQPHRYVNLGIAFYRIGDSKQTLDAFREALRINPAQYLAHYWMGKEYVRLGRLADGIRSFEETLKLNPGYTKAANRLADARASL